MNACYHTNYPSVFVKICRTALLVFLIFGVSACNKTTEYTSLLIGHAGAGMKNPKHPFHHNTENAIDYACGFESVAGVELDARFSLDYELMFFHDDDMEEETGHSACISSKSYQELQAIKYKTNEAIVALKDYNWNKAKGKQVFLDLKLYNSCDNQWNDTALVKAQLTAAINQLAGKVQLKLIVNHAFWIPILSSLPAELYYSIGTDEELKQLKNNPYLAGFCIKNSKITKEQTKQLQSIEKKVLIFDVRSPKSIRSALEKQADYIMVDDIQSALIELH